MLDFGNNNKKEADIYNDQDVQVIGAVSEYVSNCFELSITNKKLHGSRAQPMNQSAFKKCDKEIPNV